MYQNVSTYTAKEEDRWTGLVPGQSYTIYRNSDNGACYVRALVGEVYLTNDLTSVAYSK